MSLIFDLLGEGDFLAARRILDLYARSCFFFAMPAWMRRGRREGSRREERTISLSPKDRSIDQSTTRNKCRRWRKIRKRYQSLILVGNTPHLCGYSMPWAVQEPIKRNLPGRLYKTCRSPVTAIIPLSSTGIQPNCFGRVRWIRLLSQSYTHPRLAPAEKTIFVKKREMTAPSP